MTSNTSDEGSRVPEEIGQAACGIVHDLANLIQTIILRAEVTAATEPISEACAKRMDQIVVDGQGGANLIRSLLEYARRKIEKREPSDLRLPVNNAIETISASYKGKLEVSIAGDPLLARQDHSQITDLIVLVAKELLRGADEKTLLSITLSNARPEGDVMNWLSEECWAEMKIVRTGPGGNAELEEGNLHRSADGQPPPENVLNILRIKGIVRQHRGQLRTMEEIEDGRQAYVVEIFIPLL